MRKQSVGIALALGIVLMGFQNCSPTFLPEQAIQNDNSDKYIGTPEPDQYDGVDLSGDSAVTGQSKALLICPASSQKFDWPFGGVAHRDWVITHYVDSNPVAGSISDYTGATAEKSLTYDGHLGLDIVVPNFRSMDGDFPVFAAAAGTVIEVVGDQFDRVMTPNCAGLPSWNVVKIKHPSGIVSVYGHLKKNSPTVVVGEVVQSGQKIGVVGSSGCSHAPHLHFQVMDCNRKPLDPMKLGMFNAPPVYTRAAPTTLMDTVVSNPTMVSIDEMKDPGGDPMSIPRSVNSSLGVTFASLKMNQQMSLAFVRPDGSADPFAPKMTATKGYAMSHWWFNWNPQIAGEWQVRYMLNGTEVFRRPIQVD